MRTMTRIALAPEKGGGHATTARSAPKPHGAGIDPSVTFVLCCNADHSRKRTSQSSKSREHTDRMHGMPIVGAYEHKISNK
eukprot:904833-Pleurochrysis_carterae.AAC.1